MDSRLLILFISMATDLDCSKPCLRAPKWTSGVAPTDIKITKKTVRKDTVMVPAGGYVVIDFIIDNPGYWFLHCHIEPHQLEGMALVINEAQTEQNPPPDGMHSCGSFNWSVGEFNQKLDFNPKDLGSNGFSSWKIAVISGLVGVVILIVIGALILKARE